MKAEELAQKAVAAANRFVGILAPVQVERVAMSHLATWVYEQDESRDPASVLKTFNEAMSIVRRHYC